MQLGVLAYEAYAGNGGWGEISTAERQKWAQVESAVRATMNMRERPLWTVWTNTDLTEGRGIEFVKHYCEIEATARRLAKGGYVQGGDCPIRQSKMFFHEGSWYAPGPNVVQPNDADKQAERSLQEQRERAQRRDNAIARARELGLSEEDLAALQG